MTHDGFPGGFHDLAWPLAHHAAVAAAGGGGAPFDALQVHVQQALMGVGAGAGWEHGAAMGSLVPSRSPSPSSLAVASEGAAVEAALMEQLASRLGVSAPSPSSSRYASCYSTPVGSPSKPAAAPFGAPLVGADAERAAVLSCFAAAGGKLSRVASSQSLLGESAQGPAPAPCAAYPDASDGSSSDGPSRKRKAPAGKSKAKDAVTTATPKSRGPESRAKKCKLSTDAADDEERKPEAGETGRGNAKGKEVSGEPPKDYIHVRARRGQASDSHSLAERVRREKISERMKLLQDLVPGCSKVTGKAVMLDEIINYVQSLQRQVEFLSMKLSTVNPLLQLDVDSFIPKDINQPCAPAASSLAPPPPQVYSPDGASPALCYASSQGAVAQSAVSSARSFVTPPTFVNHGIPDHTIEGFQNANSQTGSLWEEDDLQSLVLMGFRGNT